MNAIQVKSFGDPGAMKLVELPDLIVAAGQIKIEVKAAGVNPVDTYIRSGVYPVKPDLPYTPGLDAAESLGGGRGVEHFRPGSEFILWVV